MYSKLALFVLSACALGVVATDEPAAPAHHPPVINNSQCDVGKRYCCAFIQDANSSVLQSLAGSLRIPVGDLTGPIGLNCNVLRVSDGLNCAAQPACCKGPSFGDLITVGCSPINSNI